MVTPPAGDFNFRALHKVVARPFDLPDDISSFDKGAGGADLTGTKVRSSGM
jgi:hypothetical protein